MRLGSWLAGRVIPASDRRAARQILWMGAVMIIQVLGGIVQVSLSARILGPEGYGVLAVIIASTTLIYGLLSIPGGDSVTTFATRGVAEGRPEEAARILRFALAVSLGLSLVAYALIAALTHAAGSLLGISSAYVDAALLYGLVGIFMATQTETMAALRLSDRVSMGLAVTIASTLTRVALLAVAWRTGGGLTDVVLAYVIGAAVHGVGMFAAAAVSAHRGGMTGFLRSLSIKVPSDVVKFYTGTFGRTTIGALTQNLDSILVAQFAGAADAGLYRAARQMMDTARRPFQVIRQGVQPEYSRQWYSRQGSALRRTFSRFTILSLALAAAGFGLLAVFREPITRLVMGPDFSEAAPLILIMLPGAMVSSAAVFSILPIATGRVWPSLAAAAASLAAMIIVILWLAPSYGAAGGAWARTASSIVSALVVLPFVVSILRQSYRI